MIISLMFASEKSSLSSLTPLVSYSCVLCAASHQVTAFGINHMRTLLSNHPGGVSAPILSDARGWATHAIPASPFRMNTCESATKQITSTIFRMNTYEKPRGRGYVAFLIQQDLLTRRRFAVWPLALRATTVSSRSQAQRVSPREIREAHPLRCMAQGATRAVPNFGGPLEIHVTFRAPVHVRRC
jgi:hypothetical protein